MSPQFNELLTRQVGNEFAASQQYIAIAGGSAGSLVNETAIIADGSCEDQTSGGIKTLLISIEESPDDLRSTADYRKRVAANLLARFWNDTAS